MDDERKEKDQPYLCAHILLAIKCRVNLYTLMMRVKIKDKSTVVQF
jgi:hypothetical protein